MTLLDTWNTLKQQANNEDADTLERLARAYAAGYARIDPHVQALIEQIEEKLKSGDVSPAQVRNMAAYKNLIEAAHEELDDYTAYMRTEITTAIQDSAKRGLIDSATLITAAIAFSLLIEPGDVPKDTVRLPGNTALDFLAEYLSPEGELYKRINGLSNYHAEQIASGILQYVGEGWGPRKIADWITDSYGMGLTDALRITRTAQLYSYRQANRQSQLANADLLDGLVWCAELGDGRACASCIALHGTVFPVGTLCDDHHNGRCALLPIVKGGKSPIEQTGEAWFSEQDEETQKSILGVGKFDAWSEGKFEFSQLSTTYDDDVFGEMRRESTLQELLADS